MDNTGDIAMDTPPEYGLKVRLNHVYPLQSKQILRPKPKQMLEMLPLTTRYLKYYVKKKMDKKKPIMDYITVGTAERKYGCPLGGIGGGTIGRGFKGEFCRFQLFPGIYEYITVPECQFIISVRDEADEVIFQSVLSTYDKPARAPATWEWGLDGGLCEYTGLYPRAWTRYDLSKYGIELMCRQVSPVIPHDYKDSSLPCGVFVWSARNVSAAPRRVALAFVWTEIRIGKQKRTKVDIERYADDSTCGVSLEQKIHDTPCTFTIAKPKEEGESIHEGYCTFNARKGSDYVWQCLKKHGRLQPEGERQGKKEEDGDKKKSAKKKSYAPDSMGISSSLRLAPGARGAAEFCLSWDMPVVRYGPDKKPWKRFYTRMFGSDGAAGPALCAHALAARARWERRLALWQDHVLSNDNFPAWLKGALFNELYYVADGGTVWFDAADRYPPGDPRHSFGQFGYLEGHEYRMYNTYDVHFYASFALAQLWPNLQMVIQYTYRDAIAAESAAGRRSLYNGKRAKWKVKDSIPHDLGDPEDQPFERINCYNIHDVSEWRDLNCKYLLQLARDAHCLRAHCAPFPPDRYTSLEYIDSTPEDSPCVRPAPPPAAPAPDPAPAAPAAPAPPPPGILELLYRSTRAEEQGDADEDECREMCDGSDGVWAPARLLADHYAAAAALLRRSRRWDADGDGLIENSGEPDQTFDAWTMKGPSAYCGGLWLGAVAAVRGMAVALGRAADAAEFAALLERARAAHERLWAGRCYRFDARDAAGQVCMAAQLTGHWYTLASRLPPAISSERARAALRTVYDNNVRRFAGGRLGAVNGYILDSGVDTSALQSMESWTGVTYSLAATMVYEGMHEEAFKTAGGMYETLQRSGLAFETPEALYEDGNHRSIGYMRPLAVWALYQALMTHPPPRTPATPAPPAAPPAPNGRAPAADGHGDT